MANIGNTHKREAHERSESDAASGCSKETALKALRSFLSMPVVFAPLFLSAWTLSFWQAWTYLAVFTASAAWHTCYIIKHAPGLLERRLRAGPTFEKRPAQRIIMTGLIAWFLAILIVSGLDHRFGWSDVPAFVVILANVLTVVSFAIFNAVGRENAFASATIEVAEGQKVISTGPYAMVRHPMYSGAILFAISMPIALGSYWAALTALAIFPLLVWRIIDEEKFLAADLPGYSDYCTKVRYRLIPGLF